MARKLKKVFSISLQPGYRNYTVRDIIDLKGSKKLTQICVNTSQEAAAAEEAGIDIILVRLCPELDSIRKAAPKTFMTASVPFIKYSDKKHIVKDFDNDLDLIYGITSGISVIDYKDIGNNNNFWTMFKGDQYRTG